MAGNNLNPTFSSVSPGYLLVLLTLTSPTFTKGQISGLDELNQAIVGGPNKKVGFLSEANFDAVHTVLPPPVSRGGPLQVVVCDGKNVYFGIKCDSALDLEEMVKNETLIAGLINGLPEQRNFPFLQMFSSTLISPRAMLMKPDHSLDKPHGATSVNESSLDLSAAINAAIVRIQTKGTDQKIRLKNLPFEFMNVHTCKSDDYGAFIVPNKSAATGLLQQVLDTGVLKIGALGPYDWGGNDGNYKVDPPTGFYPDLMEAILDEFRNLSGSDGVIYGREIKLQRIWQKSSDAVFKDLFMGSTHVTEPYYIIDGNYRGTWEQCASDSDCQPALLPPGNREHCQSYKDASGNTVVENGKVVKKCQHPQRPRISFFRFSCTTLGVDSTFFTKKLAPDVESSDSPALSPWILFGIIFSVFMTVVLIGFVVYLVVREKYGRPVFMSLNSSSLQGLPSAGEDNVGLNMVQTLDT